jgi:hypothetical protein
MYGLKKRVRMDKNIINLSSKVSTDNTPSLAGQIGGLGF